MVRWLGTFLVLTLLLTGCAQEVTDPTENTAESMQNTQQQTSFGIYVPQTAVEKETSGAVRYFRADAGVYGCVILGDDVVLLRQNGGAGELALYSGNDLKPVKTASLGVGVLPEVDGLQVSEQGIGYFDSVNNSMVFLNADLLETGRVHLPEKVLGNAYLSPDWKMVYYCTDSGIIALDLQTGISRCLKEQVAQRQEITGVMGNGEFLRYEFASTEEETTVQLINAQSGVTAQEGAYLNGLITWRNRYFLPQQIGPVFQLRFGRGEDHRVVWPKETTARPVPLLQDDSLVLVQDGETASTLTCYDLFTGCRSAEVTLNGITEINNLHADGNGGVWLLGNDSAGKQALYHWNPEKSKLTDGGYYSASFFSEENPDLAGLAQWKQNAAEESDRLGAEFLLWQDAVNLAPEGYTFEGEYLTQEYDKLWPTLEKAMSAFPDGFLSTASGKGKLKIALVKNIVGDPLWGNQTNPSVIQFWNGDTPVIVLQLSDNLERDFYHGVALLIETRVLVKTTSYYEWHKVNPSGFKYDNSYVENLNRIDTALTEGTNRYFIDLFSMSYAKEDRARIFEYACMDGNEAYFQSANIQAKLRRICKGIRNAFDLKQAEEAFLWEQYLVN